MYQKELAQSGQTLFKIRGRFIYVVIAIGVIVAFVGGAKGPFASESANNIWFSFALAVALAGALIRVGANGFAAHGTSGKRKEAAEAAELNTTGAYSLVRNPLYVGRIVNFTGIAMLSGSWVYGLVVFLTCVLIYERISIYEEEFLRGKFGDDHANWASQVPALLPRLHGFVPPRYDFWWRRMIWREYKKFFQLGAAILLFQGAWSGFDLLPWQEYRNWHISILVLCFGRATFWVAKKSGVFLGMR